MPEAWNKQWQANRSFLLAKMYFICKQGYNNKRGHTGVSAQAASIQQIYRLHSTSTVYYTEHAATTSNTKPDINPPPLRTPAPSLNHREHLPPG